MSTPGSSGECRFNLLWHGKTKLDTIQFTLPDSDLGLGLAQVVVRCFPPAILRSPLFVFCPPFHILILHSLLSVLTFSHLIAEAVLHFGDIFAVALHPSFSTLHSPLSTLHSPFSILCHQSFRTRTLSWKQCRISAFENAFLESSITMYILFLIISLLQIVLVLDYVEIVLKRRFLPLNARVQHLRNFQLSVCQSYKLFSCAGLRIKKNSRETGSRNCPGIRIFQIARFA